MNHIIVSAFRGFDPKQRFVRENIVKIITNAIYERDFWPGMDLPSAREFAEALCISERTAIRVYRDLKAMDLLETIIGVGTKVTMVLPGSGTALHAASSNGNYPESGGRHIVLNALDPSQADVTVLVKELTKSYSIADMYHAKYREASLIREVNVFICARINNSAGVNYSLDELFFTAGHNSILTNLSYTHLQGRDVVVMAGKSNQQAADALGCAGKEVHMVSVDADGIRTDELAALCSKKRVAMVYLSSNANYFNKNAMSEKRIEELVTLACKNNFLIIEDDRYKNIESKQANRLVQAAQKAKCRLIYLSTLSFAYSVLRNISVVCGAAKDIRKLQSRLDRSTDRMSVRLVYAIHKLMVTGKLLQVEKRLQMSFEQRMPLIIALLINSGHWKAEGLADPNGWMIHLEPARGKFPDNIIKELEKSKIHLMDRSKIVTGPSFNTSITLSFAAYLNDQHFEADLQFFNDKMSGLLIY
jgi:DNA-binding transcriptional MocR family regulator